MRRTGAPLWLAQAALLAVACGAHAAGPSVPTAAANDVPEVRPLSLPVHGVQASALRDTYAEGRVGHAHEAIDIAARIGTEVFAVDDGTVAKLFTSKAGGLTVYHFDPNKRLAYYYGHLDRYAEGLREGTVLHRCDLIGYVGTTGNASAEAPHLHFAVFRLGSDRHWWQGTPLNPYPALRAGTPCR